MTPRARRSLIGLAILAAVVALAIGLRRPEPVPVVVAPVERGPVETTVANTRAGTVEACRRTRLAPSVGGQVERLFVKKGDHVTAGQPLLKLWNEDLEAQLRLAKSEVEAATAQREESCLRADVAAQDFERLRRLAPQGLVSKEAADQAEGNARATRAACEAAGASLEVARDRVHLAQVNLSRTVLVAPYAGIVAEINGEPGEYVTPSPPGIATPPAVDLVDTTCLFVTAPIDEVDAPQVRVGMPSRITLDAFGDQSFPGVVRRIAPYVLDVEKQARTVEVEVEFVKPEAIEALLPGYTADVEIIIASRSNAVRVPTEALLEDGRVLVYNEDKGILEARRIRAGLRNWRVTEALEGVTPDEWVVTSIEREGVTNGARATIEERRSRGR